MERIEQKRILHSPTPHIRLSRHTNTQPNRAGSLLTVDDAGVQQQQQQRQPLRVVVFLSIYGNLYVLDNLRKLFTRSGLSNDDDADTRRRGTR